MLLNDSFCSLLRSGQSLALLALMCVAVMVSSPRRLQAQVQEIPCSELGRNTPVQVMGGGVMTGAEVKALSDATCFRDCSNQIWVELPSYGGDPREEDYPPPVIPKPELPRGIEGDAGVRGKSSGSCSSLGNGPETATSPYSDGSIVNNIDHNYIHSGLDYQVGTGLGCAGCGVTGPSNGLSHVMVSRIHRLRSVVEGGSLGVGGFLTYDKRVSFIELPGGGTLARVFDPLQPWELRLYDTPASTSGSSDTALDGRFIHNDAWIDEARLEDANGQLVTDLSQAARFVVSAHDGTLHTFEVINLTSPVPTPTIDLPLDEGTGNTTGSNSYAIQGNASWVTDGPNGNAALSLDGVNDYVAVPGLSDTLGTTSSLSFWVRTTQSGNNTSSQAPGIAGVAEATGTDEIFWGWLNANGLMRFKVGDSSEVYSRQGVNNGQWRHIAMTRSADTGWLELYVDGVLQFRHHTMAVGDVANAFSSIGRIEDTGGTPVYFQGDLSQVKVFDRVLSMDEMQVLSGRAVYGGRLLNQRDRNGYGIDISYKAWTSTELAQSPSRQWQMDTVTDDYNRRITFSYGTQQIAGRWAISRIDLPNNRLIKYSYSDGVHLTGIDHPDGTASSFGYTSDSATPNLTQWQVNDAGAEGTHRRKTVFLSGGFFSYGSELADAGWGVSQSQMLCRGVVNGAGEASYFTIRDPSGPNSNYRVVYEGKGRLRQIDGQWQSRHYKDGWVLSKASGGSAKLVGELEDTYAFLQEGTGWNTQIARRGTYPNINTETGVRIQLKYNAANNPTLKTYRDGTTESMVYNQFQQVTTYTDRLGRQTINSYDPRGNLLIRKVGVVNGVAQPEVATYGRTYYDGSEGPAVAGISGAAATQPIHLLKSSADANGNVTHYVYNDNHFLIAVVDPADQIVGLSPTAIGSQSAQRAKTLYSYDTAGRLASTTDPMGRTAVLTYDARDRQKVITYHDGSIEETFYANELAGGAGMDVNLVVARRDRNGNYTQYRYDSQGRRIMTIGGITSQADALNQSLIPDTTYHSTEECNYLDGTDLRLACVRNGERTETIYDFRHRSVATSRTVRSETGTFPHAQDLVDVDGDGSTNDDDGVLTTRNIYRDNLRFASVDPYGRATLYAYRDSDSARVRTVVETVPGGSGIDLETGTFAQIEALARPLTFEGSNLANLTANDVGGAAYLIRDTILDAGRQPISTIDPRNIKHNNVFDSRGRAVARVQAVGTPAQARTETRYDANSNVIEQRSARYFDTTDANGHNKANVTMQYNGRNRLAARTVAPGADPNNPLPETATETFTYYLDGRPEKRTDFNGNAASATAADHQWLSLWHQCCGRTQGSIDPQGHGNIVNNDFAGNVTHTASVRDLLALTSINANGLRVITGSGGNGAHDIDNAKTLAEATTRYDSRHRPVASTQWLEPLAYVDPNDVPILYAQTIRGGTAAQNAAAGVNTANAGLTTLYYYSEDIHEMPVVSLPGVEGVPPRGAGEGKAFLVHTFAGAPKINLQPTLNKLADDGIDIFENDGVNPGTNASAQATVNPQGEITVTISDGAGRTVIAAQLNPNTFQPVTWATTNHDRVANLPGFGQTLETLAISATNNLNRQRTDAAGRTIQAIDAQANAAFATYDNNNNPIRTRDANNVGNDCVFDARNRQTICTDTFGDTTITLYNQNNQTLKTTDAKGNANKANTRYDARGRLIESTSRLSVLDKNVQSYDPNSNRLTQTDAQGNTTTYTYDSRNLRIATEMPGHNSTAVVGDADYDRVTTTFDGMGRPSVKTDQLGDTATFAYDLANRPTTRTYRLNGAGTDESLDTFTYDDASRLLTATKGRYSNTVTMTYDNVGRPKTEALTTGGNTYTTTRAYDDDSRLTQLTYPDGSVVQQTYTARNQLDHIRHKSSGGSFASVASFTYDPGMRETQRTLGNGLDITRAYRNDTVNNKRDNLLDSITVAGKSDLSLRMSYDPNKNLLTEDRGTPGSSADNYSFNRTVDAKDRLTNWLRDNGDTQDWDLSFEGDWNQTDGNIGGTAFDQSRTHNAPHEILTIDPDNDPVTLNDITISHDSKGNLNNDGQGRAFTHDFDNMLSQVTVSPGASSGTPGTHSYTYDAMGRRVSKTTGGVTTVFVRSGQQIIAEYDGGALASNPERKYLYCATCYIDEPIALVDDNDDVFYYHRDRSYNIIGLTDDAGTIVELYAYTLYGDRQIFNASWTAIATSAYGNPRGFQGLYHDIETGLIYNRARMLDPLTGRFLERDPLGYPDGLNTYAAYHVMWGGVDPWGLSSFNIDDSKCSITFNFSVNVTFAKGPGGEWTRVEMGDWIRKAKHAIEDTWNNKLKLIPSKKGRSDWVEGPNGDGAYLIPQEDGSYRCYYRIWNECPCQDGYSILVNVNMNAAAPDSDVKATVEKIPAGKWQKSSAGPNTASLDSEDVNPKPGGQIAIAHEFGHMIGLTGKLGHPNHGGANEYTTPSGDPTGVGTPNDDLMGSGMRLLERHVQIWKKEIDEKRSECGPFKISR